MGAKDKDKDGADSEPLDMQHATAAALSSQLRQLRDDKGDSDGSAEKDEQHFAWDNSLQGEVTLHVSTTVDKKGNITSEMEDLKLLEAVTNFMHAIGLHHYDKALYPSLTKTDIKIFKHGNRSMLCVCCLLCAHCVLVLCVV